MISKLIDKLFIKQWSIGITKARPEQISTNQLNNAPIFWLDIPDKEVFYADPFIISNEDGSITILYEFIDDRKGYGIISALRMRPDYSVISESVLLDTGTHLSYPFIYKQNNKYLVFPESGQSNCLYCFDFDPITLKLSNKRVVLEEPVTDSTIIYYNGKYWLFCTKRGDLVDSQLFIYYSDFPDHSYQSHTGNPVKSGLDGSRPAGSFFMDGTTIMRPAQNSSRFYGESISINRILKLTEAEFEEETIRTIQPLKDQPYNLRIHTLNFDGDFCVIDGLRRHFLPLNRLKHFLRKKVSLTR